MTEQAEKKTSMTRRAALTRLGLGAAAIYAAPTVTRLDTAKAAFPSQCPPTRPACGQQPQP
ncbi:MAG: hypothetical protein ACMVY4_08465 [Minwuia sp.]|uniref:hypothetical protein n=1 Tax=Minwuia sp. TaxID=2493630 RepID=UPI003A8441CA